MFRTFATRYTETCNRSASRLNCNPAALLAAIAVFVVVVSGVFHPRGAVSALHIALYSTVVLVVGLVAFIAGTVRSNRAGRVAAPGATPNPTPAPAARPVWPMPPAAADTQHTIGGGAPVMVTADGAHPGEDAPAEVYLLTDTGVTTVTNGTPS